MELPVVLRTPVPLIGAPMAGPGGAGLARAVSRAGALGMIGVGATRSAAWITEEATRAGAYGTPYGVGLMAWALADAPHQLEAVLALPPALRPALVSVSFGPYAEPVRRLRDAGILTATQVGNPDDVDEALASEVDVVVARGGEGGGHGRNDLATLPLLQVALARADRPVYAAGGLVDHRGLAAVLAAGAAGAWVGTAFLGCVETASSEAARQALFRAGTTGYDRVFDVAQGAAWPREFGGRAVLNEHLERWAGRADEQDAEALAAFRDAVEREDFTTAHLYAGQGVTALTRETTAAEVVAEFARALHPA